MANIYVLINREVQKGNTLMDRKGNFISPKKVEQMARKSYVSDLKTGSIPFEKTFNEYHIDIIESGYVPVSTVTRILEPLMNYGYVDTDSVMPEPVQAMSENVAN